VVDIQLAAMEAVTRGGETVYDNAEQRQAYPNARFFESVARLIRFRAEPPFTLTGCDDSSNDET